MRRALCLLWGHRFGPAEELMGLRISLCSRCDTVYVENGDTVQHKVLSVL
jgi:hypothetical protein